MTAELELVQLRAQNLDLKRAAKRQRLKCGVCKKCRCVFRFRTRIKRVCPKCGSKIWPAVDDGLGLYGYRWFHTVQYTGFKMGAVVAELID